MAPSGGGARVRRSLARARGGYLEDLIYIRTDKDVSKQLRQRTIALLKLTLFVLFPIYPIFFI